MTSPIRFPEELPISARVREIAAAVDQHQVVVVAGETGSGKTTQLPKICLAMGRGLEAHIGVTQPRRIAATSVAARVAKELDVELGREVGYQIRFANRTSPATYVKFMTDGILLAEIQGDPLLRAYDTLILDEAHERNLNLDFLLGYVKRLLPKRRDLRVIVSSATLEVDRFASFFGGAPVIQVSGRTYPVDVLYRPPEGADLAENVAAAVDDLTELDPREDVLVFLPGEREIREAVDALTARALPHTVLLPLYGRLSQADQARVFQPLPQRRVVLATNVAETSLTIPGIVYVIDAGLARINRHNPRSGVTQLLVEPVSRASADQRKGRAGRTRSGVCFRLYEEQDFDLRPAYTDPEILRVGLAGAILQMRAMGLGDIEGFPFLDPPPKRAVDEGYRVLEEIGALDGGGRAHRDRQEARAAPRGPAHRPHDPRRRAGGRGARGAHPRRRARRAGSAGAPHGRAEAGGRRPPQVPRRDLRLRRPAQALALLPGGPGLAHAEPDAEAVPRRVPQLRADARVDRRPPAALAHRDRHGHQALPGEGRRRERRDHHQGAAPRAPQPRGHVAPGAAGLPRRAADALPAPPVVEHGEEAARVGGRGGAGGDLAALRPEQRAHQSRLAGGGRRAALQAELRRAALGRAPGAGDGQGARHPLRPPHRQGPPRPLRPHRPQGLAPAVHPARAGAARVRGQGGLPRPQPRPLRGGAEPPRSRPQERHARRRRRHRALLRAAGAGPRLQRQDLRALAQAGRGRGSAGALPLARRRAPGRGRRAVARSLPRLALAARRHAAAHLPLRPGRGGRRHHRHPAPGAAPAARRGGAGVDHPRVARGQDLPAPARAPQGRAQGPGPRPRPRPHPGGQPACRGRARCCLR